MFLSSILSLRSPAHPTGSAPASAWPQLVAPRLRPVPVRLPMPWTLRGRSGSVYAMQASLPAVEGLQVPVLDRHDNVPWPQ